VGEDMDGRIAAFVDTGAVERVATYDTEPVPRMTLGASGAEDEMIDRLEALGYLE